MYDNPMMVKFHLEEIERQAKPCFETEPLRKRIAGSPILGLLAVAGLAGGMIQLLGA